MSTGRWSDRSDRGGGRGQRRRVRGGDAGRATGRDRTDGGAAGSRGSGRTGSPEPRTAGREPGAGDVASTRRAGAADRDQALYERKRAQQARARARLERATYDPAPADPDAEWTIADANETGLARTPAPEPVGDALRQLLARRGWDERLTGATAAQRWDEVVGPDLAVRCEPVRLAGGTLVVRAESQPWATQLRYLLPQLVANANAVLGEGRVREVRLVVGPLEGPGDV